MVRTLPPENRRQLKNVTLFRPEDDSHIGNNFVLVEQIVLPKQQPRRYFDPQKQQGLIQSIKQHGILEPLLVRPLENNKYELIAGERRYRAAKELKLEKVPVLVKDLDDLDARQVALIENLQREDLNVLEETESILQLLELKLEQPTSTVISLLYRMVDEVKGKVPQSVTGTPEVIAIETLFTNLGIMEWTSFVSNRLPILKLPEDILLVLRQGKIAYTKAQAIARIKNDVERTKLLDEAIAQGLSLVEIKDKISNLAKLAMPETETSPSERINYVFKAVKQAKVWQDPKKKKRLEKLLSELESLII